MLAAAVLPSPRADAAEKPNIVYILADDLGYGDLGCYGQELIRTPRIDRLAEEGMRFTDHYAGAPSCAPSRCALMTGKHTGHARLRANSDRPLHPEDTTIAEVLGRSGYATGAFGKWGLGLEDSTGALAEGLRRVLRVPRPDARAHLLSGIPLARRPSRRDPRESRRPAGRLLSRPPRRGGSRLHPPASRSAVLPVLTVHDPARGGDRPRGFARRIPRPMARAEGVPREPDLLAAGSAASRSRRDDRPDGSRHRTDRRPAR